MDPRLLPPVVTLSGTPRTRLQRATLADLARRIGGITPPAYPVLREITGILIVCARGAEVRLRGEWTLARVWWAAGLTVLAVWRDGTTGIYVPIHRTYASVASIDAPNRSSVEPLIVSNPELLQARA